MAVAAASAVAAVPTGSQVYFNGDKLPVVRAGEEFANVILPMKRQEMECLSVSRADDAGFNVTVAFKFDREKYTTQMAVLLNKKKRYFVMLSGDDPNVLVEGVVPGDYYLWTTFGNISVPDKPYYTFIAKKVTVAEDMTVELSPDDATKVIKFRSLLPDGNAPVLPSVPNKDSNHNSDYDWTGATAKEIAAYTKIANDELGGLLSTATNMLNISRDGVHSDCTLDIAVNDLGDDWHFAQTRYIVDLSEAQYFAHIGVDGTSTQPAVPAPDYAEWKYSFAANPTLSLIGNDGWDYGVLPIPLVNNEMDPGMWTYARGIAPKIFLSEPQGCNAENYKTSYCVEMQRVEINREEETSWGFSIDMRGISSPAVYYDKDIQAPALSANGAAVHGSNIWWNKDNITPGIPGNVVFATAANDLSSPLGQDAPVAVVTPTVYDEGDYFDISFSVNYIGQYGEDRGGDSALSTAYIAIEGEEEIVCDYDDLMDELKELSEGKKLLKPFSVEIANDRNILFDDIAGYNNTVMSYADPSKGDYYAPTATMLQFRNSAGEVTNRFAESADGYILLSGGDFTFIDEEYWGCQPATLKVEYATRVGEEWREIAMTEEPENFLMPSFGYFWRGSLADVEGLTRDGWYQLRISMTDADGNSQVQTIYPAFCVEKFAGVESVDAADDADAPVEYFNMQGQRVTNPAAGQILVRRQGSEVSKTVVR